MLALNSAVWLAIKMSTRSKRQIPIKKTKTPHNITVETVHKEVKKKRKITPVNLASATTSNTNNHPESKTRERSSHKTSRNSKKAEISARNNNLEDLKNNDIKTEHSISQVGNKGKKLKISGEDQTSADNSVKSRTSVNVDCKKFVGAHTSVAGGLENAVLNAVAINGQSFGLFLRSQRTWTCKPLEHDVAEKFKKACSDFNFSPHLILPHGSYLLNCGSPNVTVLEKSRAALVDELQRCEMLGLSLYNFHPGSTCGEISIDESINRIAESINQAHAQTKYTTTVIENMCGQGNTLGGDFTELRGIIDRVKDKSRIGVCLDTCHAFAAGYDLSKEEGYKKMMSDFETIIGIQYLKAAHINDSKGKVGCHLDRHENIGRGMIGLKGFKRLMNDPRFNNIPLILETPVGLDDATEIKLLYSLIDKT